MESEELLRVARETIDKVTFCFAVTVAADGTANARVVQPGKLAADWSVRFMTMRRCGKVRELETTGRLTLGYLYEPEDAHVTLLGPARIIDDVEVKRSVWSPATEKWFAGGPEDPEALIIELTTKRIELWSARRNVMPEPKGFSCAVLERDGEGWRVSTT